MPAVERSTHEACTHCLRVNGYRAHQSLHVPYRANRHVRRWTGGEPDDRAHCGIDDRASLNSDDSNFCSIEDHDDRASLNSDDSNFCSTEDRDDHRARSDRRCFQRARRDWPNGELLLWPLVGQSDRERQEDYGRDDGVA